MNPVLGGLIAFGCFLFIFAVFGMFLIKNSTAERIQREEFCEERGEKYQSISNYGKNIKCTIIGNDSEILGYKDYYYGGIKCKQ